VVAAEGAMTVVMMIEVARFVDLVAAVSGVVLLLSSPNLPVGKI
jgi:hypothetical protein